MRFKIKDIPPEGLVVTQPLSEPLLKEAFSGPDVDAERSAGSFSLQLFRNRDEVVVTGALKATLGLSCAACLSPTRLDVTLPVRAVFGSEKPNEAPATEDEILAETDYFQHDNKELDLEPMLREQLILTVPMSPRCREGCRGLCPTCGQNLNEVDCGHERSARPESPFSALKNLKV
jgi:uncharacterized protein